MREALRGEALEAWGLLEDLLGYAAARGDAVAVPPLLEAEATVLQLGRVLARRRRSAGQTVIWPDDVAMVRRHLDGIADHATRPPLAHDREAVALVEAALASLDRLGELVAGRRR